MLLLIFTLSSLFPLNLLSLPLSFKTLQLFPFHYYNIIHLHVHTRCLLAITGVSSNLYHSFLWTIMALLHLFLVFLGMFQNAPVKDINPTIIFYILSVPCSFSSVFTFFHLYFVVHWSVIQLHLQSSKVSFLTTRCDLLAWKGWLVWIPNSLSIFVQPLVCADSICFTWLKSDHLHSSQYIAVPTFSCLFSYTFWTSVLYLLLMC